jgi:hypothetical protein
MVELNRDVTRLALMMDSGIGLEAFAQLAQFRDFSKYLTSRFATNFSSLFRDFSQSEIAGYNIRHRYDIECLVAKGDAPLPKTCVVPIPHGMLKPYGETFAILNVLIENCHPLQLNDDIKAFSGDWSKHLPVPAYDKPAYDHFNETLGSLYTTRALTHLSADHAFHNYREIGQVNAGLMMTTKTYYPVLLDIAKCLGSLHPDSVVIPDELQAHQLMGMAYRLTNFASVMRHILEMEHTFIQCLGLLKS